MSNDPNSADDPCACCGDADGPIADREPTAGHWLPDGAALERPLPRELQRALGRFLGTEPVETLGEWAGAVRRLGGGGSVTVADLCVSAAPTAHRGTVDGETYHFACFYDAAILAALRERPVDIRTESPGGTVIEARADGAGELSVTPAGAAFSFGIDGSVGAPSGDAPTLEQGYAAICPYVKAFPDRSAYEAWARTVGVPTVAMPLEGATALAAALAG